MVADDAESGDCTLRVLSDRKASGNLSRVARCHKISTHFFSLDSCGGYKIPLFLSGCVVLIPSGCPED